MIYLTTVTRKEFLTVETWQSRNLRQLWYFKVVFESGLRLSPLDLMSYVLGVIMFDLLLKNGRIIDGTGQTWFRASLGITDDYVTVVHGDTSQLPAGSHRCCRVYGLPWVHRYALSFRAHADD